MIVLLLIGILVVMAIWKMIYLRLWDSELSVMLSFQKSFVYAGEETILTEVVENRKKFPVSPLEVRFRVKKGILFQEMENTSVSDHVYKRDIFALLGNQRITRELKTMCPKRGIYEIKEVTVGTFSLLHEKKYIREHDTDAKLYVYARRTNVSAILHTLEALLGERESSRKYLEDPFAFASIRDYTMQDPMKTINWKASARMGQLMVNTYTSMKKEKMMIYLDVEDRGILKKEHLTEDSISVAATLYQKLLSTGAEVGICVNLYETEQKGAFCLMPSRKKGQRTALEQLLAGEWTEKDVTDFEKLLENPFKDAIPVIISKNFSKQKMEKIEEFIGTKARGIWVLPYEKGECPETSSDRLLFVKREVDR